jgi:hypothetical protein
MMKSDANPEELYKQLMEAMANEIEWKESISQIRTTIISDNPERMFGILEHMELGWIQIFEANKKASVKNIVLTDASVKALYPCIKRAYAHQQKYET